MVGIFYECRAPLSGLAVAKRTTLDVNRDANTVYGASILFSKIATKRIAGNEYLADYDELL